MALPLKTARLQHLSPKVTQRTKPTETARANIGRPNRRLSYVVSVFQRSLLSELGGWSKALALPGEVKCLREPVSGPTTIKPDWAEERCEGESEVIGLRLR